MAFIGETIVFWGYYYKLVEYRKFIYSKTITGYNDPFPIRENTAVLPSENFTALSNFRFTEIYWEDPTISIQNHPNPVLIQQGEDHNNRGIHI